MAAPWPRRGGPCLGRRDSHADQGAVATQFSSSTGTGTSPGSERISLQTRDREGERGQALILIQTYLGAGGKSRSLVRAGNALRVSGISESGRLLRKSPVDSTRRSGGRFEHLAIALAVERSGS